MVGKISHLFGSLLDFLYDIFPILLGLAMLIIFCIAVSADTSYDLCRDRRVSELTMQQLHDCNLKYPLTK